MNVLVVDRYATHGGSLFRNFDADAHLPVAASPPTPPLATA
jgi:hypothetical protein